MQVARDFDLTETAVREWVRQADIDGGTRSDGLTSDERDELALRQLTCRRTMTPAEIQTVVEALSGIANVLRTADPVDKAQVYQQFGIELTYKPGLRILEAEANP